MEKSRRYQLAVVYIPVPPAQLNIASMAVSSNMQPSLPLSRYVLTRTFSKTSWPMLLTARIFTPMVVKPLLNISRRFDDKGEESNIPSHSTHKGLPQCRQKQCKKLSSISSSFHQVGNLLLLHTFPNQRHVEM